MNAVLIFLTVCLVEVRKKIEKQLPLIKTAASSFLILQLKTLFYYILEFLRFSAVLKTFSSSLVPIVTISIISICPRELGLKIKRMPILSFFSSLKLASFEYELFQGAYKDTF